MQSPLTHVLCNYIITICISITGILKTQLQLKPGDIETNPGLKNISHNKECINISGYSLLRVNHPNSIKRGGVCLYFKESLPLIKGSDLSNISHLRMFSN